MKFKNKILIVFLLMVAVLIIGMSNKCFATASDISNRHLEKAINDVFAKEEIEFLETVSDKEYNLYLDTWVDDFWLDSHKQKFKISQGDTVITVKYELSTGATGEISASGYENEVDDQVIFKISSNKDWEDIDNYEILIQQIYERLYLCSAVAVGQDTSLALTYYKQTENLDDMFMTGLENDGYRVCIILSDLASLSENNINKSKSYYKITHGITESEKISIHSEECEFDYDFYVKYTGNEIKPAIDATRYDGNVNDVVTLTQGKDYKVQYINNIKAGKASVLVESLGEKYTGKRWLTFEISKKDISDSDIDINFKDESYLSGKTYTGKAMKPAMKIDYIGARDMKLGTDYTISYSNNTNPGEAKVIIKGKGNFTGTVTKTFDIRPKKVKGLKVSKQKTDSITIKWNKNSEKVSGYEVYTYNSKYEYWEYLGNTSKTSYTIKKLKAGTTYKYKVCAYGADYVWGEDSATLKTTTKTKTPSISSLTTKSKKATIKWGKVSGATGYEIYMATSKNGKYSKIKTITKGSTVSYTKSNLTKNKTYYFKIRTYRTVDGKKVYSSYSSVKNIKIK